jgi:hypothetical protein
MQDPTYFTNVRRRCHTFGTALALISRIKNTLFLIRGLIQARDEARAAGLLEEAEAHEQTLTHLNQSLNDPDLFTLGEIAEG